MRACLGNLGNRIDSTGTVGVFDVDITYNFLRLIYYG